MGIKIRLLQLGKRQKDLLSPLADLGIYITKDVLSRVINGKRSCPEVMVAIQKILWEWEQAHASSAGANRNGGGL